MEVNFSREAQDVLRKASKQFTAEEMIRNYFGLRRVTTLDDQGRATVDDDMYNDAMLRKMGVYDYYLYKDSLANLGITEDHMKKYFPYVQFNEKPSTPAQESPIESGLQDVGDTPAKPTRGRRKKSVEQSA